MVSQCSSEVCEEVALVREPVQDLLGAELGHPHLDLVPPMWCGDPGELIAVAAAAGCLFTVDSDAHAPGQLDWLVDGCDRLEAHGVDADRVVTTWPVERLLEWTHRR